MGEVSNKRSPRKAHVVKQRAVNTYAELWHASQCVLDAGILKPQGSSWQFLSSILLTAFTFEAYLNHIGPQIYSEWDSKEKLSPIDKFEFISELLKVQFPDGKDKRPLNTVSILFAFRNSIAHGKSVNLEPAPIIRDINDHLDSYLGQRPLTSWECKIRDDKFAKLVRTDVQAVLEILNDARPEPKEYLFMLGSSFYSATCIEK